jgi:aminoglycoside 3-N-acetyltransferase
MMGCVVAEFVRSSAIARIWPVKGLLERARLQRRRRVALDLKLRREAAVRVHGKVAPAELLDVLRRAGLGGGSVVLAQTSFNDLATFDGTASGVLSVLRQVVGSDGTLVMPAYTLASSENEIFDPLTTPTYTGIVGELFRRSPDSLRSLHPRHSLCAAGPAARELLAMHEVCALADGDASPFDRLRTVSGAKGLTLGLPPAYLSFLHWIEDIEPTKLPVRVHRRRPIFRSVRFPDGSVRSVADMPRRTSIACRLDLSRVASRLTSDACAHFEYRGVAIGVYDIGALAAELLKLRDAGIIHYS